MIRLGKKIFLNKLEQKAGEVAKDAVKTVKKESKNVTSHSVNDTYYNNATQYVTGFSENSSLVSKSEVLTDSGKVGSRKKNYRDGRTTVLNNSFDGSPSVLKTYDKEGKLTTQVIIKQLATA